MNYSAKHLIKLLLQNGFVFKRAKGSHQLYYNYEKKITVIVLFHGNKDLAKGTYYDILKQAGIENKPEL